VRLHLGASRLAAFGLSALVLVGLRATALASTAVPQWQQIFHPSADGTTSAAPIAARELADGTVLVVTGALQTVHYNHDGTIVSFKQLALSPPVPARAPSGRGRVADQGPLGFEVARAVIDGFGKVVISAVASPTYVPPDSGIIETLKFDGLTGDALWPAPVFYDANLGENPTAVFVDPMGDVVVTGLAVGNEKHFTIKYDGLDGSLLWGPMVFDGVSFPSNSAAEAMDAAGDIYVTLPSIAPPQAGLASLKYSGVNGAILWGPIVFPDPNARPGASVITPDGNYSVAAASDDRLLVFKYNAVSGATVWGPSVVPLPPSPADAFANGLTTDARGDLFLTASFPTSGAPQLLVRKLSGSSGLTLWDASGGDVLAGGPATGPLVAGNGDLLVGTVTGTSGDPILEFQRFRGADGFPEWGPNAFGPTDDFDPPQVFLGSNGRLFTSALVPGDNFFGALSSGEIDASSGVTAWGPTAAVFPRTGLISLTDLAAGPDGNPVVTGNVPGGTIQTLKYDRVTGATLWGPVVIADPNLSYQVIRVVADAANDVFVVGVYQTLTGPSDYGTFVSKYSGVSGAPLWGPIPIDQLIVDSIALDGAGNALLLLAKVDFETGVADVAVMKLTGTTGAVAWGPMIYDSGFGDMGWEIVSDSAGNATITGSSGDPFGEHWFAIKYSVADGSLLWGPSSGSDGRPYSAASDASGNLVVSGNDQTGTSTTIKYSGSNGDILWGPVHTAGVGGAVAVAPNGDVVAAGDVNDGTQSAFTTIRYDGSDGTVVWGPVVTGGPGDGNDFPFLRGLGFDASGNVVLTGTARSTQTNADVALVKYDGATGALLWGPVLVGGPDSEQPNGFDVRGASYAIGATSAGGMLTAVLNESLGIETMDIPPAFCGIPYHFDIVSRNGTPGLTWTLVSGALPSGLSLSAAGAVVGTPSEQGSFAFTVRVTDATLAHADRAFTLVVTENANGVFIFPAPGAPCHRTLIVSTGAWSSYLWLPNGEMTSTLDVSPLETTTYGVIVTDPSGCSLHLSITVPGTALQDPSCLAPGISSIAPTSGPASGGTSVTITGVHFEPGVELEIGGQPVGAGFVDSTQLTATTPALGPGTLNTVVVANPDSGNAALYGAFFADFLDVPSDDLFHASIEKLFRRGVTAGCDVGLFCPDADTTRAQMAVFLLKSLLGAGYVPPPATGAIFADVLLDTFAAAWIEDLYTRGVTGGCLTDPLRYCPDANVTRAEMAVFLLKTLLGKDYVPPPATGTVFADVPVDAFAAAFIEDLYHRGITAGCLTGPLRYCPDGFVTREEMAAFLALTFGL
jgi:hypothetical protein